MQCPPYYDTFKNEETSDAIHHSISYCNPGRGASELFAALPKSQQVNQLNKYQFVFPEHTESLIRFPSSAVRKQQRVIHTAFYLHTRFSHLLNQVFHHREPTSPCMKLHILHPNLVGSRTHQSLIKTMAYVHCSYLRKTKHEITNLLHSTCNCTILEFTTHGLCKCTPFSSRVPPFGHSVKCSRIIPNM